jgi:TetR/AcrR family transcriptional regulator, fatty acid metabolism regulator protein
MPKVAAEHLESRRTELVAVARRVFAARGYVQTTISGIARSANVSDGLLYRYFSSKRELLQAVLDVFYEGLIDNIEVCVAGATDFPDRLNTLVREHVRVFIDDPDLCRLFMAEVRNFEDYVGSKAHVLNRRYTSILMRILNDGKSDGLVDPNIDGRLVRDMLFGGIEHLGWRHILTRQPLDPDGIAAEISGLLFNGLLGRRQA